MKLLCVGHSLVVNSNRKIWNTMAQHLGHDIDLIVPNEWLSNLHGRLNYFYDERTDSSITKIYPVRTIFKGRGNFFFFHPLDVLQILNRQKYDAIFLVQETWTMATTFFELTRSLSINRKSSFFIGVDQNLKKPIHHLSKYLERFNVRNVDALLCVNREIVDVLRWKGITTKCYWRPWSYDQEVYSEVAHPPKSSPYKLGYLGRLTHEKGLVNLLEAQKILETQGIATELVIAGGGPLADLFKNKENITFLGMLPHDQAQNFYNDIDFFILPSITTKFWKEQFGRVIIESIAAAKMVLGSSSRAIPEVLSRLGISYIFKEADTSDLVRVIRLAIDDSKTGRLDEILSLAVRKNKDLFSEEAVVERISSYFEGHAVEDGII